MPLHLGGLGEVLHLPLLDQGAFSLKEEGQRQELEDNEDKEPICGS